jgi:hypothetical protein
MSAQRIGEELAAVTERLAGLRRQMDKLEAWAAELRTSLRVLARLEGQTGEHTVVSAVTVRDSDGAVIRRTLAGKVRPPATGVPLRAGEALKAMLRAKGDFIKPKEAVERLKAEHGIRIGPGKPGRETSDLSSAIGGGRVPGLVVTRSDGWGLEEWNGVPPARREASGTAGAASEDHVGGPRGPDPAQDTTVSEAAAPETA